MEPAAPDPAASPAPLQAPHESRVPPPVYPAVALIAGTALEFSHPLDWPVDATAPGTFLMIVGLGAIGWALWSLQQAGTTPEPWKQTTAIVGQGPYRFTRNPIYLGFVLVQGGLGMLLAWWWILLLVPFTWIALDRMIIRREEAHLKARFGKEYEDYLLRTRRWI